MVVGFTFAGMLGGGCAAIVSVALGHPVLLSFLTYALAGALSLLAAALHCTREI